jgi:hypothetical protein
MNAYVSACDSDPTPIAHLPRYAAAGHEDRVRKAPQCHRFLSNKQFMKYVVHVDAVAYRYGFIDPSTSFGLGFTAFARGPRL